MAYKKMSYPKRGIKYQVNAYPIKPEVINEISDSLMSFTLDLSRVFGDDSLSRKKLHELAGNLGGIVDDYIAIDNLLKVIAHRDLFYRRISQQKLAKKFGVTQDFSKTIIDSEPVSLEAIDNQEDREQVILLALKGLFIPRELLYHDKVISFQDSSYDLALSYHFSVIEHDGRYYLVVDPTYHVISKKTIYELLKEGRINKEELVRNLKEGKWFITTSRSSAKKRKRVKVAEFIEKNDPRYKTEFEKIVRVLKEKKSDVLPTDSGIEDFLFIMIDGDTGFSYHTTTSLLYYHLDEEIRKFLLDSRRYIQAIDEVKSNLSDIIQLGAMNTFNDRLVVPQRVIGKDEIHIYLKSWKNGEIHEEKVSYKNLANVFGWIFFDGSPIYLPYRIPEILKGATIKIAVIYRDAFSEEIAKEIASYYEKLERLHEISSDVPKIEFFDIKQVKTFSDSTKLKVAIQEILEGMKSGGKDKVIPFIVTIVPKMVQESFDEMKQFILSNNGFHQAVMEESLTDEKNFKEVITSLLAQFFHKLGMYYYSLEMNFRDVDFIVGFDITKEPDTSGKLHGIGGSAVVQNSRGHIISVIPVSYPQSATELGQYDRLFRNVHNAILPQILEIQKKEGDRPIRILLLKDGKIYPSELRLLNAVARKYNFEFITIEVRKRHSVRFFRETREKVLHTDVNSYFRIGNTWYITAHYYKTYLKRPVKVCRKYFVNSGSIKEVPVTEEDIKRLILLSKLNYAQISGPDRMKLPAPVHYAHLFVNSIRRGIEPSNREFLRYGFLYFI